MDEPDLAKLKLSSKIGKKAPVFTAEFSNGRIVSDLEIQFECYEREDSESMIESAKRKLVATNGRLTYIGESNDTSVLRYFIGIRNKNTGKMKLYDSTHFRLKPLLTSNDVVNNNASEEKNYWEDRNKLTEAFGGKAQQRILKSRLKLDLKDDSLGELINEDSFSASSLAPDPFANSPSCASYLPPVNREAQSLDEVFDINDIISPEIDGSLQELGNSWLEKYKADANAAKLNFLIFQNLTYQDIRRKNPTNLIPEPFKKNMLDKFTNTTKIENGRPTRSFPTTQKDKLVSHLIVLALLISNYYAPMSLILSDLKQVFPKKFTSVAQAMGCHMTSHKVGDHNEKFVELKLPLNVVLPKYKKRQF